MISESAPKYIATVKGACEVTLVGSADVRYWRDRLAMERLYPCCPNGRAEVVVSAVVSKWMGVRFRELSVSVAVSEHDDSTTSDGVFLVGAYNTSRFFAWCERAVLGTPYRHADVAVHANPPSFRLLDGGAVAVHAEMSAQTSAAREAAEVQDLKIFLPTAVNAKQSPGKLFFARLSGLTEVYPFSAADVLRFDSSERHPAIGCLIDSNFRGRHWHVRRYATHARSKTVDRAMA